jgi:hypothetical protein
MNRSDKEIKDQRQKRAIEALLKNSSISVLKMGFAIGALNPRQVVMELRRLGFSDIILTRFKRVIDRDGKICRVGEYFIPDELKPLAEESLRKYAAQAPGERSEAASEPNSYNNKTKE